MNVLIACEQSGVVRRAFQKRGHNAWSCDILPSEDGDAHHYQCDIRILLERTHTIWDLMIAHPVCTRLAHSGVRWLHVPPKGRTIESMQDELLRAATFYKLLRDAPIPKKAIENPKMHKYAKSLISLGRRQIVQPWWFGDPEFKATGFELINLPDLEPTHKLTPPDKGTKEYNTWSKVHRMGPSKNRAKERSRSHEGMAEAMADQWGGE